MRGRTASWILWMACTGLLAVAAGGCVAGPGTEESEAGIRNWNRLCGEGIGSCRANQYCEMSACGEEVGSCVTRPQYCIELYDPVCSCDGETYGNSCKAAAAGKNVAHEGECEEDIFCGGIVGFECPDGMVCELDGDYPDAGGHCVREEEPIFCGGIVGFECPPGMTCILDGDYPDAGGHCEEATDCRTDGCPRGSTCTNCWGGWTCLPADMMCAF